MNSLDLEKIEKELVSEVKLTSLQAKIFLLVSIGGQMSYQQIAKKLKISQKDSQENSKQLMKLGAFIDMSETDFEAMHPRFTVVNMYRKMCEREGLTFKRNKIVDNIGVALERQYDAARTK